MDRFYESATSLFVRAYDAFFDHPPPQIAGDVAFYERLAREAGGPVLELACGTGRIALPLAERGLDITGVDASDGMLAIAERKSAAVPAAARQRLTLVAQDMSELALDRRFGSIFVAFRSFQHLLTVDLQRRALAAMQRHLAAEGRLALHLFDPRVESADRRVRPTCGAVRRRADNAAPLRGRGPAHQLRSSGADPPRSLALRGVRRGWRAAGGSHPRNGAALDLALGTAPPVGVVRLRGGSGIQRLRGIRAP